MQHSYNHTLHTTIGRNLFEVCLGYQPLAPIDVALHILQFTQPLNTEKEVDKKEKIIEKIK